MVGFLVAGLIIGALARLIKPGKQSLGILATLGLGLVGSVIGGLIAQFFGTGSIWELNVLGFVVAVVAAVLLIGVAEGLVGKVAYSRLRLVGERRSSFCVHWLALEPPYRWSGVVRASARRAA